MLCEPTLKKFDKFWNLSYKFGFTPFKWDEERRIFIAPGQYGKYSWINVICWWISMIILICKITFLVYQFLWKLIPSGDLAKLVFQTFFLMTSVAALFHNLIFWKFRHQFVALFHRAVGFSVKAQAELLPDVRGKYPVEDDGLGANIKMGMGVIILIPVCIFFLSFEFPGLAPFFTTEFESVAKNNFLIRLLSALIESHITAFSWTGNIQGATLLPNLAHVLYFWTKELKVDNKGYNVKQKRSQIITRLYREIQILGVQFNECFSGQVTCILLCAFINQTSIIYGCLRLYNSLSLTAWLGYPYLAITGTLNIFGIQMMLAAPFETSKETIKSWKELQLKEVNVNRKDMQVMRRYIRSCYPLKVFNGSYKYLDKGSGIEWVDALIDRTITLILWQ